MSKKLMTKKGWALQVWGSVEQSVVMGTGSVTVVSIGDSH